jgi:hypothetical protein
VIGTGVRDDELCIPMYHVYHVRGWLYHVHRGGLPDPGRGLWSCGGGTTKEPKVDDDQSFQVSTFGLVSFYALRVGGDRRPNRLFDSENVIAIIRSLLSTLFVRSQLLNGEGGQYGQRMGLEQRRGFGVEIGTFKRGAGESIYLPTPFVDDE